MSNTGDFHFHIYEAVKGAQRISSWALRTFRSRGKMLLRTLLKSVIVPKLEYGAIVWAPTNAGKINLLENIQRKFTSRIAEYQTYDEELGMPICTVDYWERMKDLKLFSIERRFERFIILYMYRFVIGMFDFRIFEIYLERGMKVRRKFKHRAPEAIKKLRQSSFFYRGPQLYNMLPESLRQFEEITSPNQSHVMAFKAKLDAFLATVPDQLVTLQRQRAAETNSLVHQIRPEHQSWVPPTDVVGDEEP